MLEEAKNFEVNLRVRGMHSEADAVELLIKTIEEQQSIISAMKSVGEKQQKEIERLNESLADIAFGRVEGDYNDVRIFANESLSSDD